MVVLLDERKGDSASGEYEWSYVIAADDVPALVVSLGGMPGTDVLSWLSQRWSGQASYRLGPTLRESGIKYEFWSWP